MVGKIKTGGFFKGAVEYISQEKKGELIHKNMLGEKPNELIREFQTIAEANTRAQHKVKHHILSFADGEKLSNEKLMEISEKYLEEMGYTNNQFVVYRHDDTAHQHIHILTNRIKMDDYKCVKDSNEKRKARKVCMDIEKQYGLTRTPEISKEVRLHKNLKNYTEMKKRLEERAKETGFGEITDKEHIKESLISRLEDKPKNLKDLGEGLKNHGINMEMNKAGNGLIFEYRGVKYKGSSIGKQFAFKAINKAIEMAMPGISQVTKIVKGLNKGLDLDRGHDRGGPSIGM